ncbi:MAG: sulfite exporter TauE/SafE family protein, partial [Myxococcota bacterium]
LAGGGSLITLPALIFLGLPPGVANATNRVGILLQSTAAVIGLARGGALSLAGRTVAPEPDSGFPSEPVEGRALLPRVLAACAGAAAGASLAAQLEAGAFRRVIAVAMLVMLAVLLAKPKRWLHPRPAQPLPVQAVGFFVIGAYGGFLQAGVGIFLLAGATWLAGEDLARGNVSKNLLVAAFTVPTLAVFLAEGLVAPGPGLALAVGSTAGGFLGARLVGRLGAGFVRAVLVGVVSVAAVRLLLF